MKAFILNKSVVTPEYLLSFFQNYQRTLLTQVRSVTADNLDFSQIKSIKVPLPSLDNQNEYSNIFNNINAQIIKIQNQILLQEKLYNSLINRAFKGELFSE